MPIYEFRCRSCGKTFEKLVRTSDETKLRCPDCASGEVERLFSSFATSGSSDSSSCSTSSFT